jgi:hypothetical protein
MKRIMLLTAIMLVGMIVYSQEIPPAPEGKAVVYFARPSAMGFAINFIYFDSAKVIGRFNGPKYIRYECDPGKHIFWARSENKDFIDAEVEAGKIYFIEASPKMGAVKAGVKLEPVDPKDEKTMGKILKLMSKKPSESFTEAELATEYKNFEDVVQKGMEKYSEEKAKGQANLRLEKNMNYTKP